MPRAVLGGFFLLVCGMIAVAGLHLLAAVPDPAVLALLLAISLNLLLNGLRRPTAEAAS
jgi:xanthine/uracil permease